MPGSELCDINGNQLRDGAKWPHKAVDAAILIVVHLFASSWRPTPAMGETPEGVRLFPRDATQFATGRRGRSQRRRASPGIKRAGFPSPLGGTNSRAGTDEQVRSRRQPEDRRRFGCQFRSSRRSGQRSGVIVECTARAGSQVGSGFFLGRQISKCASQPSRVARQV